MRLHELREWGPAGRSGRFTGLQGDGPARASFARPDRGGACVKCDAQLGSRLDNFSNPSAFRDAHRCRVKYKMPPRPLRVRGRHRSFSQSAGSNDAHARHLRRPILPKLHPCRRFRWRDIGRRPGDGGGTRATAGGAHPHHPDWKERPGCQRDIGWIRKASAFGRMEAEVAHCDVNSMAALRAVCAELAAST